MIAISVGMMLLQAVPIDPRSVNPTIPYTRCMFAGLSSRLRGKQTLSASERSASFEKSLGECADLRAEALSGVDAMLARMYKGQASPSHISGIKVLDVWDRAFRKAALDPKFDWDERGPAPAAFPAQGGDRPEPTALTDDQATIVYDQCLAHAAQRASKTDAPDTAIFGLARAECASRRDELLRGAGAERIRIFDAIDSNRQARFPEATRKVRERRRAFEAQAGAPK